MWDIVWISPQGHRSVSVSRHYAVNTVQQIAYRQHIVRSCPVFKRCLKQQCFKLAMKCQIRRRCTDRRTHSRPVQRPPERHGHLEWLVTLMARVVPMLIRIPDLRRRRDSTSDDRCTVSARYGGVLPSRQWQARTHNETGFWSCKLQFDIC